MKLRLRRLMGALAADPALPTEERVALLEPLFAPHLASLAGMSRPHRDWVLDQIIQPLVGKLLPIPSAIEALAPEFEPHGASPNFLVDWRWYKTIHGTAKRFAETATDAYYAGLHHLIDHRTAGPPRARADNEALLALCERITREIGSQGAPKDAASLARIRAALDDLTAATAAFSPQTAAGFADFARALDRYVEGGHFGDTAAFAALFGRGQQYLSFIPGA